MSRRTARHVPLFAVVITIGILRQARGGVEEPSAATAAPAPMAAPVKSIVAVFGGFSSCPSNTAKAPKDMVMAAYLDHSVKAIKTKHKVDSKWFLACFSGNPSTFASIRYMSSAHPSGKVGGAAALLADFDALVKSQPGSKVTLIGHSYGAHLALKAASRLPPGSSLASIVTLDPISSVGCTPNVFIESLFTGAPATPCTEAPSDITLAQKKKIASASKFWLNHHQRSFNLLHSLAIAQADGNVLGAYPGDVRAHIQYQSNAAIQKAVAQLAASNLSP